MSAAYALAQSGAEAPLRRGAGGGRSPPPACATGTPSLPRIRETCTLAVFSAMYSACADLPVGRARGDQASTWSSRGVRPNGASSAAIAALPRLRHCRRRSWRRRATRSSTARARAGRAPRAPRAHRPASPAPSACGCAMRGGGHAGRRRAVARLDQRLGLPAPARDAAGYGRPSASQAAAAAAHSAGSLRPRARAIMRRARPGSGRARPDRRPGPPPSGAVGGCGCARARPGRPPRRCRSRRAQRPLGLDAAGRRR